MFSQTAHWIIFLSGIAAIGIGGVVAIGVFNARRYHRNDE